MPQPQEPDEAAGSGAGPDQPPEKPKVLEREWPRALRKAKIILIGLWRAGHDFNVAYKMIVSAVVLALAGVTGQWLELAVVAAASGLLLSSEMFNTAIEQLCDVVSPGHDERIGAVKDVAAVAAGTAMLFWVGVVALVAVRLIQKLS